MNRQAAIAVIAGVLFGAAVPTGTLPMTVVDLVKGPPGNRSAVSLWHVRAPRNPKPWASAWPGEELHKKWAIARNRS
ncbi:MAG: hypothetical protein WA890_09595 [Micromonospora sp.]